MKVMGEDCYSTVEFYSLTSLQAWQCLIKYQVQYKMQFLIKHILLLGLKIIYKNINSIIIHKKSLISLCIEYNESQEIKYCSSFDLIFLFFAFVFIYSFKKYILDSQYTY